ncbi:PAS domain-containing protein [Allokutzneria multivorans]|uniref:PAS domain-containing protein n=1 Tax=Allokutzneria multivorans TaxID=1142134 RepID=UPI0031E9C198
MFDAVPVGLWAVDADLRFLAAVGAIFDWPGTRRPGLGTPLAAFLGPEPAELAEPGRLTSWRAHRKALAGEEVQWRVDLPAGPHLYSLWPVRSGERVDAAVGVLLPLNAGYAGSFADTDSSTWLADVLHHLPALVAVRDRLGRAIWASREYQTATGHDMASLIGRSEAELRPDADAGHSARLDARVLASNRPVASSGRWRHPDGSTRETDEVRFPLSGPGGDPLVGHLALDVSEREAERRRAEDAERRFTAFMDHAPFDAWIKDRHGRYVWANGAHVRTLGGGDLADVPDAARWRSGFDERQHGQRIDRGESVAVRAEYTAVDGQRRCQQGFVFPLLGKSSALVGGVHADVTDLENARNAAQVVNDRFEAFMQHAPSPAYMKDAQGRYVWANRAYVEHHRLLSVEDVLGRSAEELEAPEIAAAQRREDELTLASGTPRRISTTGETGSVHAVGYRFPVPFGNTTGVAGIWVDTSELARTRSVLARWRNRHEALFGHAPIPVLVLSADGRVVDANPAFCALVGARVSELRTMTAQRLTSKGPWSSAHHDLVSGRVNAARYDKKFLRPDATAVIAAVTAVRVTDPEDGADRVVEFVQPKAADPGHHNGSTLNDTEASVLCLRAEGLSLLDIAARTGMTRRGVDYHLKALARRLRCPTNNAAALVARAYHLGVLEPRSWPPTVTDPWRSDHGAAPL